MRPGRSAAPLRTPACFSGSGRPSALAVATGIYPENPLPAHMQIPPSGREYTQRLERLTQLCTAERSEARAVATGSYLENPLPAHMQIPPFGREYTPTKCVLQSAAMARPTAGLFLRGRARRIPAIYLNMLGF
jgi:hypothetical protein